MGLASHNTAIDLAEFVRVESGFVRAVNIDDIDRLDELPRLKVTPNIVRALTQISAPIGVSGDRAWAIVGPYGAGKSMFGLLLAGLLSEKRASKWVRRAVEDLRNTDPYLGRQLEAITQSKASIAVLLQGVTQSFGLSLLDKLVEVNESLGSILFDPTDLDLAWPSGSRAINPHKLGRLLQVAARNAHKAGYAGLVIIVDEFGRFLDQAANKSVRDNLAFAQELAELAGRIRRGEMHLFVLLHQNFDDYAIGIGGQERTEWSKIQGRFRQIALLEEPDNLYELIARCIHVRREGSGLAHGLMSAAWGLVKDITPFKQSPREWKAKLPALFPLHPLSVYCLPRLSSHLGQNERTVFSFLLSNEPHSLRAFVRQARGAREPALLGLDWLCDYFLLNQANSLIPMRLRRRLAQLGFALEQVAGRDELASKIIKVIGVLELLQSPEVRPTEGVIAAALNVRGEAQWDRFRLVLGGLAEQRVVVERRYAGEFRLLSGSDLDFTEAIAEITDRWRHSYVDFAGLLNDQVDLPPLMARRHSFETGTVRIACRRFLDASQLQKPDSVAEDWKAISGRADLAIDYVLCTTQKEVEFAERWARRRHPRDRILVVPKEPLEIQELLLQAKAIHEISDREDVLADPVTREEAKLHLRYLRSLLSKRLQPLLQPGSGCARWFWRGREVPLSAEREVQSLVSAICDRVFHKSPKIANELVNRRQLSPAAVVAVKRIISGFLEGQGTARLGFRGNGPEVSIFHAVFERTGWYRAEGPRYRLSPPRRHYRLRPAWRAIQVFLDSATARRRRLSDLWSEVALPPYGIRAGLAPLLIWGALVERRGESCLYERGTYLPNWSAELYDRFVRWPEEFEIRCVPRFALRDILGSLSEALPTRTCGRRERVVEMNDFLQELFGWYRELPDFTKRTGAISAETKELRRLLSTATDPLELVLEQIPEALGAGSLWSTSPAKFLEHYASRFRRSTGELSRAYSALLDGLVEKCAALLGSPPNATAVRAELTCLRKSLSGEMLDATAKAFLLRASASLEPANTWIESVAAVVVGQPPRFWIDQSIHDFEEGLAILVERIRQTQKAQVIRARAGLKPGVEASWLTLTGAKGLLIDDVVHSEELSSGAKQSLLTAETTLKGLLRGASQNERRQVLAELIHKLWREE